MCARSNLTTQSIRRYYEQNTRLFRSITRAPGAAAIHRAVWAEGVKSLPEALDYTNRLILSEAEELAQAFGRDCLRLVDLGCGIGGSLFYLLSHLEGLVFGVGLTISPLQARLARRRAQELGLDHACFFVEADFNAPPLSGSFALAYSVEAFIHSLALEVYLQQAARLLRPGGRLALVDDFLGEQTAPQSMRRLWLDAYRRGWHAPNLERPELVVALAQAHGLHLLKQRDLTPHLRLRVLPDRLAALLLAVGERLPLHHAILPSMLGSMALQQCLRRRWIRYCFLVFEKLA